MKGQLQKQTNLFRAMGALFFISRKMQDVAPVLFQAWKDYTYERRANRIHDQVNVERDGSDLEDANVLRERLFREDDEEAEEEDMLYGEEEFIKMQGSSGENSVQILPLSGGGGHMPRESDDDYYYESHFEEEDEDDV